MMKAFSSTLALEDELLSINAIYEPDTLARSSDSESYALKIPSTDAALRLSFPHNYPEEPPSILGPESSGSGARKGAASELVSLAQHVLKGMFRAGEPCIFELVQQIMEHLQEEEIQGLAPEMDDEHSAEQVQASDAKPDGSREQLELSVHPNWAISEAIIEKKSVFLARAARVSGPEEARLFVRHLVATDKKVAKATHNITAWRILEPDSGAITYQDCDDDGESAAGGRLLHLLQIMNVWNVLVVVSRWYGGIHLGPDRFRCISNAAREALVKGGFDKAENPSG